MNVKIRAVKNGEQFAPRKEPEVRVHAEFSGKFSEPVFIWSAAGEHNLRVVFIFTFRHRFYEQMLRFFFAVTPRADNRELIADAFRFDVFKKLFVHAVGDNDRVGFMRFALENVADKGRRVMNYVAITVNVLIKILINEFVRHFRVHQKHVRGDVFRLTMKTRRDGFAEFLRYFNRHSRKGKRDDQMHHIRSLDRFSYYFFVCFCYRNAVFFDDFV